VLGDDYGSASPFDKLRVTGVLEKLRTTEAFGELRATEGFGVLRRERQRRDCGGVDGALAEGERGAGEADPGGGLIGVVR